MQILHLLPLGVKYYTSKGQLVQQFKGCNINPLLYWCALWMVYLRILKFLSLIFKHAVLWMDILKPKNKSGHKILTECRPLCSIIFLTTVALPLTRLFIPEQQNTEPVIAQTNSIRARKAAMACIAVTTWGMKHIKSLVYYGSWSVYFHDYEEWYYYRQQIFNNHHVFLLHSFLLASLVKPQSHYSDNQSPTSDNHFFLGGWGSLSSFVDDNLRQPPNKKWLSEVGDWLSL